VRLDCSRAQSGAVIVWSGISRVLGGTADLTALTNEKLPARRADLTAGGFAMLPHRRTPASFIQGGSAAAGRWPTRNEKQPIHLPSRLHVGFREHVQRSGNGRKLDARQRAHRNSSGFCHAESAWLFCSDNGQKSRI
jgi:hypothetical protein